MANIPSEPRKNGGEATTTARTVIVQKVWETKEWPKEWAKLLVIPLPKKDSLKQCQNYRTISQIGYSSKIMLRVVLNRLKAKAEKLLAEEQAGFRPDRTTKEQTFKG